ncbi:MAG: BBP7 family outer membrane beta-barrel protein [Planctomycetia bacterium]|nr:BBP7 family outer membrane beta-barrel protein [Planctomycetia bacterium]
MLRKSVFATLSCLGLTSATYAQQEVIPTTPVPSTTPSAASVHPTDWNPCEPICEKRGPWQQVWLSAGYARWWMSDAPFATPLATTGAGDFAGALGDPDTRILFGDQSLDFGDFNGLRIDAGIWLNQQHTWGLGFGFTGFNKRTFTTIFDSQTTGPALITRPIFDAQAFQQVGNIVSDPASGVSGSLLIENSARFGGFDVHVRNNFWNSETLTIDGTIGYRYFKISEKLYLTQNSAFNGGQTPNPLGIAQPNTNPDIPDEFVFVPVNSLLIRDSFETRNQINGLQLGTRAEARLGAFFVNAAGKVTLGVNQQRLNIQGSTSGIIDGNGTTLNATGGLLAVGGQSPPVDGNTTFVGNLGEQSYNQFIVMPELGVQFGVQVTSHARVYLGYEWLYINDVIRPGAQIDQTINPRYVPSNPAFGTLAGPNAPNLPRVRNDFVAQGISAGLEIQY